jgi:dolichyl-phosphate-mannose-protein mannosyltransferase
MRIFSALFGAGVAPLAYFTALEMHYSKPAAILAGLMVVLGNSSICYPTSTYSFNFI